MNNQALKDVYNRILRDYERFLEEKYLESNSDLARLSGIFLPSVHENYANAPRKVMLVGRETAGWKVVGKGRPVEKYPGIAGYINESMGKHRSYLDKEAVEPNEHGATFHNFIKKLIPVVGHEGLVWANLFCFDLKKNYPASSPRFQTIKEMSKRLLAEEIKTLNPDVIIFANGAVSACYRAEFFPYKGEPGKVVCSNFADPGKDFGIGNKFLWQFDLDLSDSHRCYRIHHPSCFSKSASRTRDFLVNRVLPDYFSTIDSKN